MIPKTRHLSAYAHSAAVLQRIPQMIVVPVVVDAGDGGSSFLLLPEDIMGGSSPCPRSLGLWGILATCRRAPPPTPSPDTAVCRAVTSAARPH